MWTATVASVFQFQMLTYSQLNLSLCSNMAHSWKLSGQYHKMQLFLVGAN